VQAPVLVLQGPTGKRETAQRIASRLTDARIAFLDLYSLPPLWGDGDEISSLIEAFLDEGAVMATGASPGGLSPRQAEVLRLIAEGRSNKEIAEQLVLSLRTVERHVADLYTKLDIRNRAEATAFAMNLPNRR
jgi:DNA-binding CsgD family transcriptional regulator